MLKHRLIFGPLMIAVGLLLFYLDERLDRLDLTGTAAQAWLGGRPHLPAGLLLLTLFLMIIPLAAAELRRIFLAVHIPVHLTSLWLSGTLGCLLVYILPHHLASQSTLAIYATGMVGVFLFALIRHSWRGQTEGAIGVAAVTMLVFFYLGALPGFYLAIRRSHSAWVVAAVILICKACDIGAYFTGRLLGRHQLIPWLSPGKTWEGLLGGVVTAALVAVALVQLGDATGTLGHFQLRDGHRALDPLSLPLAFVVIAGLIIGLTGQLGDLTISLFKRDAGIKDSGSSIPGFGGVLDVIDSPLLVAPVAYWLLQLAAIIDE